MTEFMWTMLIMVFIHFLCDFPLQGSFLADWKQRNNYALFVHCFIWTMGLSIGLNYFGLFEWWKFAVLFIGHFLMDGWKCRGYYKKMKLTDMQSFYIDQIFHLLQIMICMQEVF